jgi:hypothetical protein
LTAAEKSGRLSKKLIAVLLPANKKNGGLLPVRRFEFESEAIPL